MADSIDTQLLIWGIKRKSTPNRKGMIERAAHFFQERARFRERLILPAPALAEFLVDYDQEQRDQTIAVISKGFIIAPYDAKAAKIAAELMTDWKLLKSIGKSNGLDRQTIKADITILATAIAAGAGAIYSEDAQMPAFAQNRIAVKPLPPLPMRNKTMF